MMLTRKKPFLFVVIVSVFVLACAFYLEYKVSLVPCPLCILQRITFFALALLGLLAYWARTERLVQIAASAGLLFSLLGGLLAMRQLYLQNLPVGDTASCLPPLSVLLSSLPIKDFLSLLFSDSAHCGLVQWRLWGLSIPAYALFAFVILGLLCGIGLFQKPKKIL